MRCVFLKKEVGERDIHFVKGKRVIFLLKLIISQLKNKGQSTATEKDSVIVTTLPLFTFTCQWVVLRAA